MKKKTNKLTTFLLIISLIAGLSLLLYPTVSDHWNSLTQSKTIASYVENVADLNKEKYDGSINAASEYHASLSHRYNSYVLSEQQKKE